MSEFEDPVADPELPYITAAEPGCLPDPVPPADRLAEEPHDVGVED
jgi:hypothetical protein